MANVLKGFSPFHPYHFTNENAPLPLYGPASQESDMVTLILLHLILNIQMLLWLLPGKPGRQGGVPNPCLLWSHSLPGYLILCAVVLGSAGEENSLIFPCFGACDEQQGCLGEEQGKEKHFPTAERKE